MESEIGKFIQEEMKKTGKTKAVVLEETFKDGYVVVSEAGGGTFKVESAQLFKPEEATKDDLAECRRLRERFGPISSCVDYIKDVILGGGYDIILSDFTDAHQKEVKKEIIRWMKDVYQDAYTIGFSQIIDILVDNAITDGFAASEVVYETEPKSNCFFNDYAKPITDGNTALSIDSESSGKIQKPEYTSYEIKIPQWSDLKGIARMKIFLDAPTRLRLYRQKSWEANYWVLDEPNVTGLQNSMYTASQKNLQQNTAMQMTEHDLVASTMGKKKEKIVTPAAYLLPWQVFSLSLNRRNWLEKGPSMILPALKTAQLLEKIMNAVGEGIYRAGNKKYFIICGSPERPWGGIHVRNLLSELKDASEKNWSTIPVPSGFDLKEAGGTVFEAQNAINYFLRVIAGIMHVNPSVLGLDTREARNVTELPYFTHLRVKEGLQKQIETQLIRLHIWAKYGQKKSKQGGYDEPQFVPELRARSEDLLNPTDRLKLDIDILNAANPVRPELKLETERDIVKVRGWDVILPTQEEFKKEQEDLAKEMKAQLAEKAQGPPQPPTEEKQLKRQMAGVSRKTTTGGKQALNPMGSTRTPAEVQETLMMYDLSVEESEGKTTFYNPLTGSDIEIVQWELSGGIAGYNEDQTKIYVDPLVPKWMYVPLFAHEIYEMACVEDDGISYQWAHTKATGVERAVANRHDIDWKKYDEKYHELLGLQDARKPQSKQPKDIHEGFIKHGHKRGRVYHIQETVPQKNQLEVIVRTEPQEIILKDSTEQKELEKKQTELIELQGQLTEEQNKREQEKLRKEIEKLESEITESKANTERANAEKEKADSEKEEIQKTHNQKRKVLSKMESE